MQSPFPGMDPYIEASGLWEDFHEKFIGEIERTLSDTVPDHYVVRLAERSYIALEAPDQQADTRHSQADVAVMVAEEHTRGLPQGGATAVLEAVTAEPPPVTMTAMIEAEYRETFIEITALRPERKLVTTVEILSPSNKRFGSPGWDLYLRKRQAHFWGQANLVEIDLLRGGRRMPMEQEWPDSPFYLLTYRKHLGRQCTVWPAHFVRPLPALPIPLASPDPDVPLSLQPLIDRIYERSRYARDIDYRKPCRPRLSPTEAKWLEERLQLLQSGN